MDSVQAFDFRRFRHSGYVRCQRQRRHGKRKKVLWKVCIEEQKGLTWNPERQFHAGKHDELLFLRQGFSMLVRFVRSGTAHIRDERHIVVICNCDSLKAAFPAGLYEHGCIIPPPIIGNAFGSGPINVSRSMDLKIAVVEMCPFVSQTHSSFRGRPDFVFRNALVRARRPKLFMTCLPK